LTVGAMDVLGFPQETVLALMSFIGMTRTNIALIGHLAHNMLLIDTVVTFGLTNGNEALQETASLLSIEPNTGHKVQVTLIEILVHHQTE